MARLLLLLPLLLLSASQAVAGIYLDRIIVEFDPGGLPRQDVVVINDSTTENAYVDVEILEVRSPGAENEERVLVTNPQESGLLVTPARMVVAPGGRQQVRLVNLTGTGQVDRVYRVNFKPVLPPLSEEDATVRIVVAYQALVLIPPAKPTAVLNYERDGTELKLENVGNSYIRLENGTYCETEESDCIDLEGTRLYAGNSWELELPGNGVVRFNATNAQGVRSLVIEN
jgi:P pilus assembly chaperone PapD